MAQNLENILEYLKESYFSSSSMIVDDYIKCKRCKAVFKVEDPKAWIIDNCKCPNCGAEFCFIQSLNSNELKLRKLQQSLFLYPESRDKYLYLLYKELVRYSINIISSFNRNYSLGLDYYQVRERSESVAFLIFEKYLSPDSKFFVTKSFGSFLKLKALQVLYKDKNPFTYKDDSSFNKRALAYVENNSKFYITKFKESKRFYFYLDLLKSFESPLHFFIKFYKHKNLNQRLVLFIIYMLIKKGEFFMDIDTLIFYIISIFNKKAAETWKLFKIFKEGDNNYLDILINLGGTSIFIPSLEEYLEAAVLAQLLFIEKFDTNDKKLFNKKLKLILKNIPNKEFVELIERHSGVKNKLFEKFKKLVQMPEITELLYFKGEKI